MTLMQRTRVLWSGFQGQPGYTNLFTRVASLADNDPTLHAADVAAFFTAINTVIPTGVRTVIDPEVAYIEDTTGEMVGFGLLDEVPAIEPPPTSNTGGNFASPAGAAVHWLTQAVRDGRRVRGTTFLVPLRAAAFQEDGTLTSGALATIRTAASAYAIQSTTGPVVWSRPQPERVVDGLVIPGREGSSHTIEAAAVRDKVAILRTRRD